jgi:hypothetical protein
VLLGMVTTFDVLRVLTYVPENEPHAGPSRHTGYTR